MVDTAGGVATVGGEEGLCFGSPSAPEDGGGRGNAPDGGGTLGGSGSALDGGSEGAAGSLGAAGGAGGASGTGAPSAWALATKDQELIESDSERG